MHECRVCGYVYHDASEGTKFSEVTEDYRCPVCNARKDKFRESA